MYRLIATIEVIAFDLFEQFEAQAASIMADYGGSIESAYETKRNTNDSGEEVHVVVFASEEDFKAYTQDERLAQLSELRAKAISATDVKRVVTTKAY